MNRRSFFRWLGIAGAAVPAIKAAKVIAESLPSVETPAVASRDGFTHIVLCPSTSSTNSMIAVGINATNYLYLSSSYDDEDDYSTTSGW